MKKLAFMFVILLVFSTVSFAAEDSFDVSGTADLGGSDSTATLEVKLSNNVKMDYSEDATNDGDSYAVAAGHEKGTKTYGSSSGDAKIFAHDTLWTDAPDAPSTNTASADFSGWDPL